MSGASDGQAYRERRVWGGVARPVSGADAGGRLLLVIACCAAVLAYLPTFGFEFVHDDTAQIVANPLLRSWHDLDQLLAGHVWRFQDPDAAGNFFRPLFGLWLFLNYQLFGEEAGLWHASAVTLHVLVTGLVFLLAGRLLGDRRAAGLAAVAFACHPVHVEAVAWVSGATEPLLAAVLLGSFVTFAAGPGRGDVPPVRRSRLGLVSVGLYLLALLAKETAVVLPVLVFLHALAVDRSPAPAPGGRRRLARALGLAAPYLLATAAYLAVRLLALGALAHRTTPLPAATVVLTWPALLLFYLKHLLVPLTSSPSWDVPYVDSASLGGFLGPLAALVLVGGAWVWLARRVPLAGRLAPWISLPLLPLLALGSLPPGDFAHDRYLYVPSVGLCILIGVVAARACRWRAGCGLAAPLVAAAVLGVPLSAATLASSRWWADELALFTHAHAVAPDSDAARNNLGVTLAERGRLREAAALFTETLRHDPRQWEALMNLGHARFRLGELAEAERLLGAAIRLRPRRAEGHYYLGLTRLAQNRPDAAAEALREAVALRPDEAAYRAALAEAAARRSRVPSATTSTASPSRGGPASPSQ